ncbi:hypothetical protein IFR05_012822 [Cadophora sp. M221]|nr:hypothetical protein IFR05_012822 [Cadophora sp. M221]
MSSSNGNDQSEDFSTTMTPGEKDEMVGGFLTLIKADKKKVVDTNGEGILTCVFNAVFMASFYLPFTLPAAVTIDKTDLAFGFDLPAVFADYLQTLTLSNVYKPPVIERRDKTIKGHYTEEQEEYFWKLITMALMLKGEALTPAKHFAAIADAMHRKFSTDAFICNSGYNNMDSHAKKADGEKTWTKLLADLGIAPKLKHARKQRAKKQKTEKAAKKVKTKK